MLYAPGDAKERQAKADGSKGYDGTPPTGFTPIREFEDHRSEKET